MKLTYFNRQYQSKSQWNFQNKTRWETYVFHSRKQEINFEPSMPRSTIETYCFLLVKNEREHHLLTEENDTWELKQLNLGYLSTSKWRKEIEFSSSKAIVLLLTSIWELQGEYNVEYSNTLGCWLHHGIRWWLSSRHEFKTLLTF